MVGAILQAQIQISRGKYTQALNVLMANLPYFSLLWTPEELETEFPLEETGKSSLALVNQHLKKIDARLGKILEESPSHAIWVQPKKEVQPKKKADVVDG